MNTVTQQNTGQETLRAVAEAGAWSAGWGDAAAFLAANPDLAKQVGPNFGDRALCVVHSLDDPAQFMAAAAKACLDAGGRVEQHQSDKYGGVNLWFGPVHIYVYTDVDRVFTKRVVGLVGQVEQVEYTLTFDLPEQAEAVSQ